MSTNNQISPLQFCCNTSIPFLNNPKCLNLSSKTDLDFWNCFGRKITPSYTRTNMVYFENKTPQKVFENSKPKTGLIIIPDENSFCSYFPITYCLLVNSSTVSLYSTVICWTSPFVGLGVSGLFCHFNSIFDRKSRWQIMKTLIRCHIM